MEIFFLHENLHDFESGKRKIVLTGYALSFSIYIRETINWFSLRQHQQDWLRHQTFTPRQLAHRRQWLFHLICSFQPNQHRKSLECL